MNSKLRQKKSSDLAKETLLRFLRKWTATGGKARFTAKKDYFRLRMSEFWIVKSPSTLIVTLACGKSA